MKKFNYEKYWSYHYASLYDPGEKLKRDCIKKLIQGEIDDRTKILDVGAGAGVLAEVVTTEGKQANYFCLDIAFNQLKIHSNYAEAKGYPALLIQGDAQNQPIRDSCFGLVFCSETLEHLEFDVRALKEIGRVLRPNGRLVLTVPYGEKLSKRLFKATGHINTYDERLLHKMAVESGVEVEAIFFMGRMVHLVWTIPKLVIYLLWLIVTRNLIKRLRGVRIPSYYNTTLHKKFIMPIFDRILGMGRPITQNPYSVLGKALTMIALLKKL